MFFHLKLTENRVSFGDDSGLEDNKDLRYLFRTALAFAGYRVVEAGDGLAALRLFDTERPDLVVLDLGLPLVSGEVVLQEIAAQAHVRGTPVVVVTASLHPHALEAAACVLTKPVTPERLVMTVERCMASGSAASSS